MVTDSVNRAFSKQAIHYDTDDEGNIILQNLRKQVYHHLDTFLKPASRILEINAGTGIDAMHLVSKGHRVHAIDIAEGMIEQINLKIRKYRLENSLTARQLSYTDLHTIESEKFDNVFSNFGGLNCVRDLSLVTRSMRNVLKPGAYITWVIMPPIYFWEWLSIFKGSSTAFRRLRKHGTLAHLEGEVFRTYYHSLSEIKKAFGNEFSLVKVEGLAAVSPPPHRPDIPVTSPRFYQTLLRVDNAVRKSFPFNRCADHIITTFRFNPPR